ncbi:MAG: hypothetical protein E7172_00630 [Firmicutes bacterium]|nr:hypothetical protein [Bacillota bacterium]
MNNYLIPANAKKSRLILGFFTPIDLILFGSGCSITILMLIIMQNATFGQLIVILMPAVITGFLVMPVRHYHNILQLLTNIVMFYSGRRRYYWKGWCISDDAREIEQ